MRQSRTEKNGRMKKYRRTAIGILSAALAVCAGLAFTAVTAEAKSAGMKLPVEVMVEQKNSQTGKWEKQYTVYYKYNKKGDLTRIDLASPEDDKSAWIPTIVKYTYKDGVKTKATATDSYGSYTYKFDKKGRVTSVRRKLHDAEAKYIHKTSKYIYDKNGAITVHTWTCDDKYYTVKKAEETFTTTFKKGMISKVRAKRTGWLGIKSTQTRIYNGKGLLKSVDEVARDGEETYTFGTKYSYTYDKSGKYVKVRKDKNLDGNDERRTYTYGKVTASQDVYRWIINLDERHLIGNTERVQM